MRVDIDEAGSYKSALCIDGADSGWGFEMFGELDDFAVLKEDRSVGNAMADAV